MSSWLAVLGVSAGASATLVLFLGPSVGWYPPLEVYNTSTSVPPGYYLLTMKWPPERGDIVMMRDPPHFKLNWLLKRVEGVGGDEFCWHPELDAHTINGLPMTPIPIEAKLRHIPVWHGCRKLEADEIAGYGDGPLAYGSAYFGPVKLDRLWGVYRPW